MAKATVTQDVAITLELSALEAQYVCAALLLVNPTRFNDDGPWDALNDALAEAGIVPDDGAAEPDGSGGAESAGLLY